MSSPEPLRVPPATGEAPDARLHPAAATDPGPRAARLGAFALGAGLLAALASWGIGESVVEHFRPKTRVVQGNGGPMTISSPEEIMATQSKNATLAYGLFGAVLGLALGAAGGLARSSLRSGVLAGAIGLVLGALAGAGATIGVVPLYHRFQEDQEEKASRNLTVPLLAHGAIWMSVGAAGGLAFGLGAGGDGRVVRALAGGVVGAAIGAAVYELAGALTFPLDKTVEPISLTWASRLLARASAALLTAAGIALAVSATDRMRVPREATGRLAA